MVTDQIEKKHAPETELLRRQLMEAQKLSSVGTLASSVVHEFNNILTTLINYAKIGLNADEEETRTKALEKILRAGQRAATITTSMLGFARKSSTRRELCDITALVEEVLILTEKDLKKHRIEVETDFSVRPRIPVVSGQIEQVVLNLVINARQAMPNGGSLKVGVRINHHTEMAEISLSDTGEGIPPDKLRCIFDPFYTTKEPDSDGSGGTGLGLSVCRQIIEQHQGRIRAESLVGQGSTFTLKLPVE